MGRDIAASRWLRRGVGTQCATTLSHVGVLMAAGLLVVQMMAPGLSSANSCNDDMSCFYSWHTVLAALNSIGGAVSRPKFSAGFKNLTP